jgi:hypothetical protein
MNIYHLKILNGADTFYVDVHASLLSWSEAGLYEFTLISPDNVPQKIAYYPVNNTIIQSIEYDVKHN